MARAEELEHAAHRVGRAEQRRVDVDLPEVVERRPRQGVLDLPKAGPHREAGGKVWHQAAAVVREHALARVALQVPGIDEAGEGGGGLVGPAEGPPQAIVGPALGRIVGPRRAARRVQPHGAAGLLQPGEQRLEARIVERDAQDVGVQLGTQRAELGQGAVELARGLLDVAHRQCGRKADEAVWKPPHQVRHRVIGEAGQLRRDGRRPDLFQRWHGQHQDLGVRAGGRDLRDGVHRAPPRVQVGQHRIEGEDALAVVGELARRHGLLELPLQPREIRARQDVRERIDLPHG